MRKTRVCGTIPRSSNHRKQGAKFVPPPPTGVSAIGCLRTEVGGFVDSAKCNGDEPMVAFTPIRRLFLYAATALCLVGIVGVPTAARGQEQNQDEEVQMGQEVFKYTCFQKQSGRHC